MENKLSSVEKLAVAERLLTEVMKEHPNYSTLPQAVYFVQRVQSLIEAGKPEQIAPIRKRKGR
jgi:hypothetical protein